MGTKTYPLEVEEGVWQGYKDTVPRSQNLDDPLIEFIEARQNPDVEVEFNKKDADADQN